MSASLDGYLLTMLYSTLVLCQWWQYCSEMHNWKNGSRNTIVIKECKSAVRLQTFILYSIFYIAYIKLLLLYYFGDIAQTHTTMRATTAFTRCSTQLEINLQWVFWTGWFLATANISSYSQHLQQASIESYLSDSPCHCCAGTRWARRMLLHGRPWTPAAWG